MGERYLWYRPLNYAASEEGTLDLQAFPALAHHMEVAFECSLELWDLLRDGNQKTTFFARVHPNISLAHGQPFVTLQRNFVKWLSENRQQRGSPVWVLLRYVTRLWCSIEKMLQTVLLNTEWCRWTSFRQDLTFARMGVDQQEQHHHQGRDDNGSDDKAITSAMLLGPERLEELRTARQNHWTASGFTGVPELRSAHPTRRIGPAFVAFARKISPTLRTLLAGSAFEQAQWEHFPWWPLATRVWELSALCPRAGDFNVWRRGCGATTNRIPCALHLLLESPGCRHILQVKERVAVAASNRIFALQAGGGWDEQRRAFASPGIMAASTRAHVEFFTAPRSLAELEQTLPTKVRVHPPGEHGIALELEVEIGERPTGGASFGAAKEGETLLGGQWQVELIASDRVAARRTFYVFQNEEGVSLDVLSTYFQLSTFAHEEY